MNQITIFRFEVERKFFLKNNVYYGIARVVYKLDDETNVKGIQIFYSDRATINNTYTKIPVLRLEASPYLYAYLPAPAKLKVMYRIVYNDDTASDWYPTIKVDVPLPEVKPGNGGGSDKNHDSIWEAIKDNEKRIIDLDDYSKEQIKIIFDLIEKDEQENKESFDLITQHVEENKQSIIRVDKKVDDNKDILDKDIIKLRKGISDNKENIKKTNSDVESLTERVKQDHTKIEKNVKDLIKTNKSLSILNEDFIVAKKVLDRHEESIDDLYKKLSKLPPKNPGDDPPTIPDLDKIKRDIKTLRKDLDNLEKNNNIDHKNYEKLIGTISDHIQEHLDKINNLKEGLKELKDNTKLSFENYDNIIAILREDVDKVVQNIDELKDKVTVIRSDLNTYIEDTSKHFNKVDKEIADNDEYTKEQFKLVNKRIDNIPINEPPKTPLIQYMSVIKPEEYKTIRFDKYNGEDACRLISTLEFNATSNLANIMVTSHDADTLRHGVLNTAVVSHLYLDIYKNDEKIERKVNCVFVGDRFDHFVTCMSLNVFIETTINDAYRIELVGHCYSGDLTTTTKEILFIVKEYNKEISE